MQPPSSCSFFPVSKGDPATFMETRHSTSPQLAAMLRSFESSSSTWIQRFAQHETARAARPLTWQRIASGRARLTPNGDAPRTWPSNCFAVSTQPRAPTRSRGLDGHDSSHPRITVIPFRFQCGLEHSRSPLQLWPRPTTRAPCSVPQVLRMPRSCSALSDLAILRARPCIGPRPLDTQRQSRCCWKPAHVMLSIPLEMAPCTWARFDSTRRCSRRCWQPMPVGSAMRETARATHRSRWP